MSNKTQKKQTKVILFFIAIRLIFFYVNSIVLEDLISYLSIFSLFKYESTLSIKIYRHIYKHILWKYKFEPFSEFCHLYLYRHAKACQAKFKKYFFSFPRDPFIKEKWIKATGRLNWFPAKSSTICSEHFHEVDFIVKKSGNKFIKDKAEPSKNILTLHSLVSANNAVYNNLFSRYCGSSAIFALCTDCKLIISITDYMFTNRF